MTIRLSYAQARGHFSVSVSRTSIQWEKPCESRPHGSLWMRDKASRITSPINMCLPSQMQCAHLVRSQRWKHVLFQLLPQLLFSGVWSSYVSAVIVFLPHSGDAKRIPKPIYFAFPVPQCIGFLCSPRWQNHISCLCWHSATARVAHIISQWFARPVTYINIMSYRKFCYQIPQLFWTTLTKSKYNVCTISVLDLSRKMSWVASSIRRSDK